MYVIALQISISFSFWGSCPITTKSDVLVCSCSLKHSETVIVESGTHVESGIPFRNEDAHTLALLGGIRLPMIFWIVSLAFLFMVTEKKRKMCPAFILRLSSFILFLESQFRKRRLGSDIREREATYDSCSNFPWTTIFVTRNLPSPYQSDCRDRHTTA